MAKPKSVPIGPLVGGVGAILLLVSLFLDWYEDVTGFTVFEALDLVLVAMVFLTIVSLAGGLGTRWPGPTDRPLRSLAVAITSVLIVASQLVNDPPAVAGSGGPDHGVGIWLALGGAALMVAGALASVGHISYAVDLEGEGPVSAQTPGTSPRPRPDPGAPTAVDQPKREDT